MGAKGVHEVVVSETATGGGPVPFDFGGMGLALL